jgi:hypothetical protein
MTTATTKRKKREKSREKVTPDAEFRALVSSLHGSMAWLNTTVDTYLAEKHAETDAENEAWENKA